MAFLFGGLNSSGRSTRDVFRFDPRALPGQRVTVLKGLSDDQRLWYFRSAWNVAALNCVGPNDQPILDGYRTFLTGNAKTLRAVNQRLDAFYAKQHSSKNAAIADRERQMTVVYNYFAMPPARTEFCNAARQVAAAQAAMAKPDAAALAAANFVQFEMPFENFFTAYEQYQRDSAAWDAQYGARYGASQPGYVAVHGSGAASFPQAGISNPAATTTQPVIQAGAVTDSETGAAIPVLTVPQTEQSVPVVQPIAKDAPKR